MRGTHAVGRVLIVCLEGMYIHNRHPKQAQTVT